MYKNKDFLHQKSISIIAKKLNKSEDIIEAVVNSQAKSIVEAFTKLKDIQLLGFGTFQIKEGRVEVLKHLREELAKGRSIEDIKPELINIVCKLKNSNKKVEPLELKR